MRVWVYPERTWEELGAERYVAEWYEVPKNWAVMSEEQRDAFDPASFPCVYEEFRGPKAKEQAVKCAKKAIRGRFNAFGDASVQKQVVDWYVEEDRVAEWVNAGEPEYQA